jgi:hypothetical protein
MLLTIAGERLMDALTLTFAMVLSLSVGLAGARGALGLVLYLLEARHGGPDPTPSVVPARAAGGPSTSLGAP